MADCTKSQYKDVKAAKASLSGRIGWITRTSKDIKAAIVTFQTKNNDRNAAKLEGLDDSIDVKMDSIQECGDWIFAHGEEDEAAQKAITDKITTASDMVVAAKKDIMECLKDHSYTAYHRLETGQAPHRRPSG